MLLPLGAFVVEAFVPRCRVKHPRRRLGAGDPDDAVVLTAATPHASRSRHHGKSHRESYQPLSGCVHGALLRNAGRARWLRHEARLDCTAATRLAREPFDDDVHDPRELYRKGDSLPILDSATGHLAHRSLDLANRAMHRASALRPEASASASSGCD